MQELTERQLEIVDRTWNRVLFEAQAELSKKNESLDLGKPEHHELLSKALDGREPSPRLRQIIVDRMKSSVGEKPLQTKAQGGAMDAMATAAVMGSGVSEERLSKMKAMNADVGGERFVDLYAKTYFKNHPDFRDRLQAVIARSPMWEAGQIAKTFAGRDISVTLFNDFPPTLADAEAMKPFLPKPHQQLLEDIVNTQRQSWVTDKMVCGEEGCGGETAHRKYWDQLIKPLRKDLIKGLDETREQRVKAEVDKILDENPSYPISVEHRMKEQEEIDLRDAEKRAMELATEQSVYGQHRAPMTEEEAARQFFTIMTKEMGDRELGLLFQEHPYLTKLSEGAAMVVGWSAVNKAVQAPFKIATKALPKVLKAMGLAGASAKVEQGLGRMAAASRANRGAKLATEGALYSEVVRNLQNATSTEDSNLTLWDSLFSGAVMGAVGQGAQKAVQWWAGRRLASTAAAMLAKGEGAAAKTVPEMAAEWSKYIKSPERLQGLVEVGALEVINWAHRQGEMEGKSIEGETLTQILTRLLGMLGTGALMGIGKSARHMPFTAFGEHHAIAQGKGTAAGRRSARAQEAWERFGVRKKINDIFVKEGVKAGVKPAVEIAGQSEIGKEPTVRDVMEFIYGGPDEYAKAKGEITRTAIKLREMGFGEQLEAEKKAKAEDAKAEPKKEEPVELVEKVELKPGAKLTPEDAGIAKSLLKAIEKTPEELRTKETVEAMVRQSGLEPGSFEIMVKPGQPGSGQVKAPSLRDVVKESGAKISEKDIAKFEATTKAVTEFAAKKTGKKPEEIQKALGRYEVGTPETRRAAEATLGPEMPKGMAARGHFDPGKGVTHLYAEAGPETLVHEQAHALYRVLEPKGATRAKEEAFADQYQAFVETGKVPEGEHSKLFEELKSALTPEPTPNFVMLRMAAKDRAIAEAAKSSSPQAPTRAIATPTATEPKEGAWGFVGTRRAQMVAEAHATTKQALAAPQITKHKRGKGAVVSVEKASKETDAVRATWHLRDAVQQLAIPGREAAKARDNIHKLIEAIPLPKGISSDPQAKSAYKSLLHSPRSLVHSSVGKSGGTRTIEDFEAIAKKIEKGEIKRYESKPDGSQTIEFADGNGVHLPSAGGHDPILFQLGPKTAGQNANDYLSGVEAFRTGKFRDWTLDTIARIPKVGKGLAFRVASFNGWVRDTPYEAEVRKLETKMRDLTKEVESRFQAIAKLDPYHRQGAYMALEGESTLLPNHPAIEHVNAIRKSFAKYADVFIDNDVLKPEVKEFFDTHGGYAPWVIRKHPEAFMRHLMKSFGVKPGQPVGGPFMDTVRYKVNDGAVRRVMATNLRKRTLTKEEAKERGKIEDVLVTLPVMWREGVAAETLLFFESIAKNVDKTTELDWVRSKEPEAAEQYLFKKLPDTKGWGKLRNQWLRRDIYFETKYRNHERGAFGMFFDQLMNMGKAGFTATVPASIMTNFGGNLMMNGFLGAPFWRFGNYVFAKKNLSAMKEGKVHEDIQEIIDAGLMDSGAVDWQMLGDEKLGPAIEGAWKEAVRGWNEQKQWDPFWHGMRAATLGLHAGFRAAFRLIPYGVGKAIGHEATKEFDPIAGLERMYRWGDRVSMLALYHGLKTGNNSWGIKVGKEQALAITKWFYDYKQIPVGLKGYLGRKGLFPFISFPVKVLQATAWGTMASHYRTGLPFMQNAPAWADIGTHMAFSIGKWVALAQTWHSVAAHSMGLSRDEYDKKRVTAAYGDELRSMFMFMIGAKENGEPIFLDLANMVPWFALSMMIKRGGQRDPWVIGWIGRQNILTAGFMDLLTGYDWRGAQLEGKDRWLPVLNPLIPGVLRNAYQDVERFKSGKSSKEWPEVLARMVGVQIKFSTRQKQEIQRLRQALDEGHIGEMNILVPKDAKGKAIKQRYDLWRKMKNLFK